MTPKLPFQGILFDLDGTLVDTAEDLTEALALALASHGVSIEDKRKLLRTLASHGSLAMVQAAVPQASAEEQEHLRQAMLREYDAVNGQKACLFEGIEALLDSALSRALPLGIVTNKPARFTRPLLECMGLLKRFDAVVSADTTLYRKPHPAPMLLAAQQLNCATERILYLGDAERDIAAAQAVNMPSAIAMWGYLAAEDKPAEWGADWQLNHPQAVMSLPLW
ncbi:HAD family hydrolase [Shewanella algae]|uniref:HAD family hydrolase n=1 Tax=Shewanella algae TaxID=38313 RepID=UPI001684113D|nr:HAD-IA family hydrolase [Shewanella algae]MBO2633006.1 HAD-IA family hydrolase [Shewanella algae]QNV05576.1 HAD family hydrolase [Shewanella algae]HEW9973547.1 HAD-IA family hydrolase [Shewanella algae]